MAVFYRLLKQGSNEFRNTIIALSLSNLPKSSMLVRTKPDTDLFFAPSKFHF